MSRGRILLVDDSDSVRVTLAAILEDANYQVVEACSYAEAQQQLARGQYDVVMSDQNLGDGRGDALVPMIRALQPRARVVLFTGDSGPFVGADVVIVKGGRPEDVLKILEQMTLPGRPESS